MSRKLRVAMALLPIAISGCANIANYQPLIDTKGVDSAQYSQDLQECRSYGQSIDVQAKAITGAIIGALATAATVAIALDSGDYMSRSAGVGALAGAARGGGDAMMAQRTAVNKCLEGRGYSVLQ